MQHQSTLLKKRVGPVLSFGELLLRICPDSDGNWLQQNTLPFYVGGSEANVAAALAQWQVPVMYVSRVPDNAMCRQVVQYLQNRGIDVGRMLVGGERLGLYFLPRGSDLKHAAVIYDRAYSSFAQLQPGMIDWKHVLHDVAWLHFSAISPALSAPLAALCLEAVKDASQNGITVSVDLNYRAKLWQWGKAPADVLPELVSYCDVVMGNIWAFEKMLGITLNREEIASGKKEAYLNEAHRVSRQVVQQFPTIKAVANTFRFDQQAPVQYYATLFGNDVFYQSAEYKIEKVIDNVGTGDCFMAGLIYGFYHQHSLQETLDFATAAAVKKLSQTGDFTSSTLGDIQQAIKPYAG